MLTGGSNFWLGFVVCFEQETNKKLKVINKIRCGLVVCNFLPQSCWSSWYSQGENIANTKSKSNRVPIKREIHLGGVLQI